MEKITAIIDQEVKKAERRNKRKAKEISQCDSELPRGACGKNACGQGEEATPIFRTATERSCQELKNKGSGGLE